MQLKTVKELLTEDDAVSPVIGVILMVAITVILAAVIASFVLGLGDQAQQATPQASFSWDYDASAGNSTEGIIQVTHDGGDTITGSELYVRGEGLTKAGYSGSSLSSSNYDISRDGDTEWATATGTSEVTAGNSADIAATTDYDLSIVYETAEGDSSATLSSDSGPDA
ncbi:type IV pilin [Haloarcula argentinensis]|uniref:Type IV pilin N-terminal domain-containing protein n=1 Tax=Haloarcula argentinensis TaxID=43776 RepID=A0ABU2F317_HALAR|nr:type IV pilin N-terminal domain-containing protein [Haloarcula argentinensis]EMA20099.1 hypothetical protein C443_14742 [Haloarcula argentinensis DSM 12282]MDS0254618.1 type IV pilin N-terminal domain-containing protein [Haloarcula argentinensis]